MRSPRRSRLAALACGALLLAATGGPVGAAHAASAQESTFQDDNALIFSTPDGTAKTLDTLAQLGVDRIRVSVFWATVAPDPTSRTRPKFDATDPASYPAGAWDRYDQVIRLAAQRGIAVNLDLTSPAPLWATDPNTPRADIASTYAPDPAAFAQFAQAVGTRYSGSYRPPAAATRAARATTFRPARENPPLCALLGNCPNPAPPAPAGEPLPRVDYYSIWNEPNQAGWLTPQWTGSDQTGWVEASPRLYRGLVDGAYSGLQASGHGNDTILVGDTAPKGLDTRGTTTAMKALHFIRQLYCVDDALHPLTGDAAKVRGCPDDPGQFAAQHPGLFQATGFAHHPYELYASPSAKPSDPDYATIANLPALTHTLGRIFAAYGRSPAGLPVYLTEFGYNTNPPNPAGVTPAHQAAYLDQAEFIARSNPFVRTLTQFQLVDDARRPAGDGVGYGTSFQTGLEYHDGRRKPSFAAYELPLWVPSATVRRGHSLRVWGLVRPARRLGAVQRVSIQLRANGRRRTLRTVTTRPGSGILDVHVRLPGSGSLRLTWKDPRSGTTVVSRSVAVKLRRR